MAIFRPTVTASRRRRMKGKLGNDEHDKSTRVQTLAGSLPLMDNPSKLGSAAVALAEPWQLAVHRGRVGQSFNNTAERNVAVAFSELLPQPQLSQSLECQLADRTATVTITSMLIDDLDQALLRHLLELPRRSVVDVRNLQS